RLNAEGARRKRKRRIVNWLMGIYGSITVSFLIVFLSRGIFSGHWGHFPWWLFHVFQWISLAAAASGVQKSAAVQLAKFEGKEIVGPLIEALSYVDSKAVVKEALTKSLPKLQTSDAELLTDEHHQI